MKALLSRALPLALLALAGTSAEETAPTPEARAISASLDWLKRHQSPDGHWSAAGFDAACKGAKCQGPGTADYDVGVSALACLALLRGGEPAAPGSPLEKGLAWLTAQQSADGCVGPEAIEKHLYNHALATQALCEAVIAVRGFPKPPAQKALDHLLACQNPQAKGGGWRYRNYNLPGTPSEQDGNNDTSCTACAILAMASATQAGFPIPGKAVRAALAWLDSVYEKREDLAIFGYLRKANGNLGMVHQSPYTTTAMGALCYPLLKGMLTAPAAAPAAPPAPGDLARWIRDLGDPSYPVREAASKALEQAGAGAQKALEEATNSKDLEVKTRALDLLDRLSDDPVGQAGPGNPDLQASARLLLKKLPEWKSPNLYFWHFGTGALAQRKGKDWRLWKEALLITLVVHQETQGCAKGSWDPAQDIWGDSAGRVCITALATLCIEEAIRIP